MSTATFAISRRPGSTVVRVGTEYRESIAGLLYSLGDLNQSLMMGFRAVYAAYLVNQTLLAGLPPEPDTALCQ